MNILVPVNFPHTPLVPPTPHYTDLNILSLIQSISAEKIKELSTALSDLIVLNLGDNATERYSKTALNYSNQIDIRRVESWDQDYLPCNDHSNFMEILNKQLSKLISAAFSTPQSFVDDGLTIVLSNDEPLGPLLEALNKTNMPRFLNDIPKNYRLDLKLIQDKHGPADDLLFGLSQTINGFEFYLVFFKL